MAFALALIVVYFLLDRYFLKTEVEKKVTQMFFIMLFVIYVIMGG